MLFLPSLPFPHWSLPIWLFYSQLFLTCWCLHLYSSILFTWATSYPMTCPSPWLQLLCFHSWQPTTSLYSVPAKLYLQEPIGFTSGKFCDVFNIEQIISPHCPHHPKFSPLCISNLEEWKHYMPIAKDRELEVVLDSFLPISPLIQSLTWSYR